MWPRGGRWKGRREVVEGDGEVVVGEKWAGRR